MAGEVVTLYRPVGPQELQLLSASGFRRWPARLPGQPIFYPVTNLDYARQMTISWNIPAGGAGYVTRFSVKKAFMDRYPVHQVGSKEHMEWWIPSEDLEALNDNIVGPIEVIEEYKHDITGRS